MCIDAEHHRLAVALRRGEASEFPVNNVDKLPAQSAPVLGGSREEGQFSSSAPWTSWTLKSIAVVVAMSSSFALGCMGKIVFRKHHFNTTKTTPEFAVPKMGGVGVPKQLGDMQDDLISSQRLSDFRQLKLDEFRRWDATFDESSLPTHDVAYTEAFVHPAIFAHEEPSHVAIVGSTDATVLREVLKHKNVKQVTAIGGFPPGDKLKSSSFLRSTNDCIDIVGLADACADDPRVTILDGDAMELLEAVSSTNGTKGLHPRAKFDVVLVSKDLPIADHLRRRFWHLMPKALQSGGLVLAELGDAPFQRDTEEREEMSHRFKTLQACRDVPRMKQIFVYEESNESSFRPQSFMLACTEDCRENWYRSESYIDMEVLGRIRATRSGTRTLRHFDGSAMQRFQRPPRAWESSQCRKDPELCKKLALNQDIPNFGKSNFEVKMSSVGDFVGRGVFTKVDIPRGAYVFQDIAFHMVKFPPETSNVIYELADTFEVEEVTELIDYMEGYGYEVETLGDVAHFVDSGIGTFMNHGCNGTNNFGGIHEYFQLEHLSEEVVTAEDLRRASKEESKFGFNPYFLRHVDHEISGFSGALRDIAAGEELFTNYLMFTSGMNKHDKIEEDLQGLRAQCRGTEVGLVVKVDTR